MSVLMRVFYRSLSVSCSCRVGNAVEVSRERKIWGVGGRSRELGCWTGVLVEKRGLGEHDCCI